MISVKVSVIPQSQKKKIKEKTMKARFSSKKRKDDSMR